MTRTPTARTLTFGAAAVGGAVTVIVSLSSQVRFAYRNPSLHVALDTTDGLIALLVAYLVLGRYRQSGQGRDLLLAYSLVLFGISNLFFSAVPALVSGERAAIFSTWAPVVSRLLATTAFAAAAFVPRRASRVGKGATAGRVMLASGVSLAAVAVLVAALSSVLPRGVETVFPAQATRPDLHGHAAVLAAQLASTVLFIVAAIGFTRVSERESDEMMAWFAAGSILSVFARLTYFLFPSLYSDFVYVGDFLRLGFWLMLLVGAGREIRRYWEGLTQAAVLEERRIVARDLHDGLAQEVAFIFSQSRWLSKKSEHPENIEMLTAAAERALDESRRAIAALTRSIDEPLDTVVAQAAEEVARRVDVSLRLDLDDRVEIEPDMREPMLRIVREAVTNAARHGHAQAVTVSLKDGPNVRLKISDDGVGLGHEPEEGRSSFEVVSMRERAEGMGADFEMRSAPGRGTEIEVVLPSRSSSE